MRGAHSEAARHLGARAASGVVCSAVHTARPRSYMKRGGTLLVEA